jgi:hypothetical protein
MGVKANLLDDGVADTLASVGGTTVQATRVKWTREQKPASGRVGLIRAYEKSQQVELTIPPPSRDCRTAT